MPEIITKQETARDLVSIIIPLYNSEDFIGKCVQSCVSQIYCNIEIIIVDDGSTDNGLAEARKLSNCDERIKVYHKKNGGVSSARNYGLRKASGKYVCFIDADDYIDPGFIETFVGYMTKFNADFCFSINTNDEKTEHKEAAGGVKRIANSDAESLLLSQRVAVGCWNKMYRKDILEKISFHEDLFYGEGLFFINEVAHNAKCIVVCDDALYHYVKVNPASATTVFSLDKMKNGEKSLFEIWKMVGGDGVNVRRIWNEHYCLFCINAINGLLKDNNKIEYKKWRKKLRSHSAEAIIAKSSIRTKLKIILYFISPRLVYRFKG